MQKSDKKSFKFICKNRKKKKLNKSKIKKFRQTRLNKVTAWGLQVTEDNNLWAQVNY